MKIAVCFSGQIRTGVYASPNIKKYIGDLWQYCTFFCHTWNINTRKPFNANGIQRPDYPLNTDTINQFVEIYNLQGKITVEDYQETLITKYNTDWNPMHYSWQKSMEIRQEYQSLTNLEYDIVVKLRPDLLLRTNRSLAVDISNCLLKHNINTFFSEGIYPGPTGIIDDTMYFAKANVMDRAVKFADRVEVGQYQGLKSYLDDNNIPLAYTCEGLNTAGYTILREESIKRNVLTEFNECFEDNRKFYDPL